MSLPASFPGPVPTARVLVIEDDLLAAQLLQQLLTEEGFSARCAPDGAEGLAVASAFDPHFVLLDLQLPVVHGIEVAQHLRVNEHGLQRVIVGTSGMPTRSSAVEPMFDHWLPKPINVDELCALLRVEWQRRFAEGAG